MSPWADGAAKNGFHRRVLAIEHAGDALETVVVEPGDLDNRTLWGERAGEHGKTAFYVDGIAKRMHNIAIGPGRIEYGDVLSNCLAGHG